MQLRVVGWAARTAQDRPIRLDRRTRAELAPDAMAVLRVTVAEVR